VGLAGTGKSTVVKILAEQTGAETVYFGGQVIEEVERRGLRVTEYTEREVREELRSRLGMGAIAELSLPAIRLGLGRTGRVLVDGLYGYAEFRLLEDQFETVCILAVHASRPIRVDRLAMRPERPLSQIDIDSRDLREIEKLDKATPIALADFHIVNDDDLETLGLRLKALQAKIGFE
jgi:dephospho-CoA kinase